ncbi:MAG: hypothetical protein KBF47_19170 [Gemmatimonadales bacterium]|nr:hypothetical protein [Gemmatimonadales bacterium]
MDVVAGYSGGLFLLGALGRPSVLSRVVRNIDWCALLPGPFLRWLMAILGVLLLAGALTGKFQ